MPTWLPEKKDQEPGYISMFETGELKERVDEAGKQERECTLCPHRCGVDRRKKRGFCDAPNRVVMASYGPHFGEEAPLVGKRGSGTIFFGYCTLRCIFCQNHDISFGGEGRIIPEENLSDIMLRLQNQYRCHNINLVTPTHYVPNILRALLMAVDKGLSLPLVYNCGGFENLETLKLLRGIIDIYMPDFKYDSAPRALAYSRAKNYPERARESLREMDRQVGGLQLDGEGIAYRGMIVRHLMLPGGLEDTKRVLDFIKNELSPRCLVNLMKQYYPAHRAHETRELARGLSPQEYKEAYIYAEKLGLWLAD